MQGIGYGGIIKQPQIQPLSAAQKGGALMLQKFFYPKRQSRGGEGDIVFVANEILDGGCELCKLIHGSRLHLIDSQQDTSKARCMLPTPPTSP